MNCKISFLLPSNRHPDIIRKITGNINSLGLESYEIVVASTEEVVDTNTVWVEDKEECGCVYGFNLAYKHSVGEYIILSTDDHVFDENVRHVITELELSENRYKILSITGEDGRPCCIPSDLPPYQIVRFPVMARETIENDLNGYVYNPNFKHHYPDNWLGFWLGEMGQPSSEISYTKLHQIEERCCSQYDSYDRDIFYKLIEDFRNGEKSYVKT